MELMDPFLKTTLLQPRIEEIKKYRATNLEMIDQIEMVNREGLQYFLSNMIWSITHLENYVKNMKRELVELIDNIFDIEH